jgi:Zn-finger protein
MKEGASFTQNRACPYFPCHQGIAAEEFNCLLCYCPLYLLGEECGGNFFYTPGGIKSCMNCTRPHDPKDWEQMMEMVKVVVERARKR